MSRSRDWRAMREMMARLLMDRTGEGVAAWNERIEREAIDDEAALRAWLTERGVTGYARSLLVMERFGYPDYLVTAADDLIDRQYADRRHLRPIYDRIIAAAEELGEVTIQARKTYVSLVSPRRTFARIKAATKSRVDLGLRLDGREPGGRLEPANMQETMRLQMSFSSLDEVDSEAIAWLKKAYDENR